jgi:ABC-type lipoprotein export system ATPase subunit
MALIELQNIHKKYQLGMQEVEALKGISLVIEKGEFVSIVGKNGCGKSTLAKLIVKLINESKLLRHVYICVKVMTLPF